MLGSSENRECQIDSLAQSWGILSGAARPERAKQAMDSVREHLLRRQDRMLLLFTPPFDQTSRDPGYIKGYPPGIRENGGQYTHAAIWAVWAFAELGEAELASRLYQMLSPIHHGDTREKAARYQVEPYVVAADIYSQPPHVGRGGWTWYTGSGGWTYRLGLEIILGIRRRGDTLQLKPCIPKEWRQFRVHYRYGQAKYDILVTNPEGLHSGVSEVRLDGEVLPDDRVPLAPDAHEHHVEVVLGERD
jgi:cyclic beta-1,2-glucan synthetase